MSDLEVFRAAIHALRQDANTWQAQAKAVDEIVNSMASLHLGTYAGTLLAQYRSTYEEMWTFYKDRCTEASAEFNAVARTINGIATKYEQQEAELLREWQQHRERLRQQQGRQ